MGHRTLSIGMRLVAQTRRPPSRFPLEPSTTTTAPLFNMSSSPPPEPRSPSRHLHLAKPPLSYLFLPARRPPLSPRKTPPP